MAATLRNEAGRFHNSQQVAVTHRLDPYIMPQPFLPVPKLQAGDGVLLVEFQQLSAIHRGIAGSGGIEARRLLRAEPPVTRLPLPVAGHEAGNLALREFNSCATQVRGEFIVALREVTVPGRVVHCCPVVYTLYLAGVAVSLLTISPVFYNID